MPPRLSTQGDTRSATDGVDDKKSEQTADEQPDTSRVWRYAKLAGHHLKHHVGVGIICSVAYFDP